MPAEPGDIFGHADGVLRFVHDGLVVINDYRHVDRHFGKQLRCVLRRHRLDRVELPYFIEQRTVHGIPSALGNYVNFLRLQQLLIVPAYGVPTDELALRKLSGLVPDVPVVSLDCRGLARHGGVLNCATWTVQF